MKNNYQHKRCPIVARVGAKPFTQLTHLLDYHDNAANVTNSAFYTNCVTAGRAIATSKQNNLSFLWPNP